MTRILITTVFIALSSLFGNLHSQTFNFQIFPADSNQFPRPIPGPYFYNDTLNFEFDIFHTDSAFFNDSIWILQKVNSGPVDTVISTFLDTLTQFQQYRTNFRDTIIPARYGGINVVVIWPSAPNVIATDSAKVIDFFVKNGVGIGEPSSLSRIKIYPNPTADLARIEHDIRNHLVKSLELYTIDGRLIRKMDEIPDKVDVGYLADGHYLLRLTLISGESQTMRLVKQRE